MKTILSCLKSATSNLSNYKIFAEKEKMRRFGTKHALFWYFWPKKFYLVIFGLEFQKKKKKNYCHVWNRHPPICLIAKFCGKTKMPNFKTKNAWHGYLSPKMPYLGISGQELKKNYCQTWNQHLKKRQFPKSYQKTTRLKLRTKNAWFMYFWAGIWKQHCGISNQHHRISLITNFCKKTKMPHFGTKNALFGYFWERIFENYCRI